MLQPVFSTRSSSARPTPRCTQVPAPAVQAASVLATAATTPKWPKATCSSDSSVVVFRKSFWRTVQNTCPSCLFGRLGEGSLGAILRGRIVEEFRIDTMDLERTMISVYNGSRVHFHPRHCTLWRDVCFVGSYLSKIRKVQARLAVACCPGFLVYGMGRAKRFGFLRDWFPDVHFHCEDGLLPFDG